MPVQVGGAKVAEPKGKVELAATAVAEKGRASSKKSRRRQKKAAAVAAAAAVPVTALQKLYDTCRDVFSGCSPGVVPPPEAVARLSAFLDGLKPQDVGLNTTMSCFEHVDSEGPPRVTYLHFYDCPKFSFGVFCLPKSAVIPLHNHPGMTVFSKILFGSMHLKSYDWVRSPQDSDDTLRTIDGANLAKVNTDAVFEASSETVVLYPENGGNMHCFSAVTSCAVLDVMGPPYSRADGRDCSYYDEFPYSSSSGGMVMPDGDERYTWLREIPSNFQLKVEHKPPRIAVRK